LNKVLHLQNNQSKTDWKYGSAVEHLQVPSPEFKPQFHKNKKIKKKIKIKQNTTSDILQP
jgi:hypothetical protein